MNQPVVDACRRSDAAAHAHHAARRAFLDAHHAANAAARHADANPDDGAAQDAAYRAARAERNAYNTARHALAEWAALYRAAVAAQAAAAEALTRADQLALAL